MSAGKKRGGLADLMGPAGAALAPGAMPAAPITARPSRPAARPSRPAAEVPDPRTPNVRTPEVRSSDLRSPGLPKYKQLERKDVLLWPDQLGELSTVRRMLNRRRGGAGERITENTLIRVAVALLLDRTGELEGTTEDELRRSVGLD